MFLVAGDIQSEVYDQRTENALQKTNSQIYSWFGSNYRGTVKCISGRHGYDSDFWLGSEDGVERVRGRQ